MALLNTGKGPALIVVIGTSAGGLNALTEMAGQFDPEIDAAIFVVMHLSKKSSSEVLAHKLQSYTSLKCKVPRNDVDIEKGNIYIAPADHHILLKDGKITLGRGPEENRWRPSIDVLFRSAAAQYNGRTVGIILTGLLHDGVAGMLSIQKAGGTCIVQDPHEAEYPDMPLAVLNSMEVDYCVRLQEIGRVLQEITQKPVTTQEIPEEVKLEAGISEKVAIGIDVVSQLGDHSIYSCPDCGGGLWKITEENTERYRCHVGHSFSENDLNSRQSEEIETTLWVAVRMMEERRNLLRKMESDVRKKGFARMAASHGERAEELQAHIDKLKSILFTAQSPDNV